MRLGGGTLLFEPVEHWEKLLAGWSFIDVAGVEHHNSVAGYWRCLRSAASNKPMHPTA